MTVQSEMIPAEMSATESEKQTGLVREGQRRINLIWEYTQAIIALCVVIVTLFVAAWMVIKGRAGEQIPTIFAVAFGTIVGFYFARTNHSNIGGVGYKATEGPESRR
jgi:hypothetical protein